MGTDVACVEYLWPTSAPTTRYHELQAHLVAVSGSRMLSLGLRETLPVHHPRRLTHLGQRARQTHDPGSDDDVHEIRDRPSGRALPRRVPQ